MINPSEQFLDLYRRNLEAMAKMARAALDEAEQLRTRQLEAIRAAVAENADCCRDIASASTWEELMAAQKRFGNHQLDVAIGYWSKLFEAARHTQVETMKLVEAQTADLNANVSTLLDNAPAGSDAMVTAMRSMLEAARAAYGFGAQATEQAARLTEAQLMTATAGIREAMAGAQKKSA